ncbi:MAG: TonB-dependent receptor [Bacteroidota bacterium]
MNSSQKFRLILGLMASVLLGLSPLYAQDRPVTGNITDSGDNTPLIGATIQVKGAAVGTVTDVNGNFSLDIPAGSEVVVFSYIGYLSKEVEIGDRIRFDVQLAEDVQELDEVVVIGYGTQKKSDLTGSVATVSGEELTKVTVAGIDQALQGKAAGVQVTQSSGRPGAPVNVRIRGVGTVNNTEPLYVVDGIPMSNSDVISISPNDIESMTVLKDASATAIYGSRAANGVVMITTKRGKAGKIKVNFSSYAGVSNMYKVPAMLNNEQYISLADSMYAASGLVPEAIYRDSSVISNNTDWIDQITRQGSMQNYYLSISGGSENSNYSLSAGYFDQKGIVIKSHLKRYTLRANSDFIIGKRIKAGSSVSISRIYQDPSGGYSFRSAYRTSPLLPVYDSTNLGGYAQPSATTTGISDYSNEYANLMMRDNWNTSTRLVLSGYASIEIFKGLTYKMNVGGIQGSGRAYSFTRAFNNGNSSVKYPTVSDNYSNSYKLMIDNLLTYQNSFDKHNLSVLIGHNAETNFGEYMGVNVEDVPDLFSNVGNWAYIEREDGTNNLPNISGGDGVSYRLISYFGRLIYNYDSRYYFTGSVRQDGSSRFGPENKWGIFPSFAGSWRVSNESFFQSVPVLNDLKLRVGWGETGNQDISNFAYLAFLETGDHSPAIFGTNQILHYGAAPINVYPNSAIKWETTIQTNVGVDMALLENRILATIDYFIKDTEEMLVKIPIPATAGYHNNADPYLNIGKVQNKGFEFFVSYRKKEGDFTYEISANAATLKNRVVSLGDGDALWNAGLRTKTEEGYPIGSFFGYVADGIFQNEQEVADHAIQSPGDDPASSTSPGDIRFKDLNGNGIIDNGDQDKTHLGKSIPSLIYGMNFNFYYKGIDFSLFLQGIHGVSVYNNAAREVNLPSNIPGEYVKDPNKWVSVLDYWSPQNTSSTIPRAIVTDPNNNSRISSYWLEDGSYLRLKNVQVGYTLPGSLTSRANITSMRIYVSAQNLFTFTKYSGLDPEVGTSDHTTNVGAPTLNVGVDDGIYPQARTVSVGIQVDF